MANKAEMRQTDLDKRILEELREDDRTQEGLVAELGEPHDRIRTRLQFLSRAGYITEIGKESSLYALRQDPQHQAPGMFDDSHYLVRVAASAAVMILAGGSTMVPFSWSFHNTPCLEGWSRLYLDF